jgi:hypothetical protein
MTLTEEERFALEMLLAGSNATSAAIRAQIDSLEVVERRKTGVGFFTTMKPAAPLRGLVQRQWDWTFEHRQLSQGGSFMCWIDDMGNLELEAVVHDGQWPRIFNTGDFKEA